LKLVCDEGVQKPIVDRLRLGGYDVLYIAESNPGADDATVLSVAAEQGSILVTTDKDFGELVHRQGLARSGVLLVRLSGLADDAKAEIVFRTLQDHEAELAGAFGVISPGRLRVRR
jgi:predicted nuclease of predicted toxin-antitoxin system